MSQQQEIKETLRQWVLKKSQKITEAELTFETALLESRILTSLHVMELILEIERISGAKFNLKNMKPGAFNSINNIYTAFFGIAK
jgi:acyl carrier protein